MRAETMVLVLAGGEGRRMGGDKPVREIGGRRLIDIAVDCASAWSPGSVAVAGALQGAMPDHVSFVADFAGIDGPLAGLAAGFDHAAERGFAHLLAMPVDTPFLPADLPARLGKGLERNGAAGCAVAASGGRRHLACSLWHVVKAQALLPSHLASGDRSLHGLADAAGAVTVEWQVDNGRDPFFNINHPSDLALAERMWALSREAREG